MSRSKAFTLIELLVVIAIIAVLAAILFPVFAAAKDSAKRTTVISNLDQIGKATHLYLNDYDDTLPPRFGIASKWPGYDAVLFVAGGGPGGYNSLFGPYLPNKDVWYSPDDRLPVKGYTSFTFNEQLAFSWPMS